MSENNNLRSAYKALMMEFAQISGYLSAGDRVRIIRIVDSIHEEVEETKAELDELVQSGSKLISAVITFSGLEGKQEVNRLYNRFADFMITLKWHILWEEGKDVGERPWTLEEAEEVEEEPEIVLPPGLVEKE